MWNNLVCHLPIIINPIRHKIALQSKCFETFYPLPSIKIQQLIFWKLLYNHEQPKCTIHVQEVLQYHRKNVMYQKFSSILANHRAREYDRTGNPKPAVFPEPAILLMSTEAFLSSNVIKTNASASLLWYSYTLSIV